MKTAQVMSLLISATLILFASQAEAARGNGGGRGQGNGQGNGWGYSSSPRSNQKANRQRACDRSANCDYGASRSQRQTENRAANRGRRNSNWDNSPPATPRQNQDNPSFDSPKRGAY